MGDFVIPGKRNMVLNIFSILLAITITGGCSEMQPLITYKPPLAGQGELYFYLQPLPQEMEPISFTVADISAVPEQGAKVSLLDSSIRIEGREGIGVQQQLASEILPPGRYKGIQLLIEQATITTEEGEMDLLPPSAPIMLELSFSVLRDRSLALFLVLSPEYLVTDGFTFTPRFAVGKPFLPPKNFMGFVSNTNENLVKVFNKRTMEIVQVIHTGVAPKGMALDQREGVVYVALAGDDTIELINLTTMALIGRIRLRFGDEPVELALTPDGQTLLSANQGSGTISIIDIRSLAEIGRLNLNPDPVWIVSGEDNRRAYVLHTLTNSISVVDLSRRSLFASISLDEAPVRGALSRDGDKLYVINDSTDLLVVDTQSLAVTDRIFIGSGSTSLKVDPKSELVYVSKKSGEVVVVDPSNGMFIDSFPVARDVGFVAIDGEENVLLTLSSAGAEMQKFNLISKREIAHIAIEKGGHSLVVMGEL